MKPQSDNLEDYLQVTPIIDWDKPEIIKQTNEIIHDLGVKTVIKSGPHSPMASQQL